METFLLVILGFVCFMVLGYLIGSSHDTCQFTMRDMPKPPFSVKVAPFDEKLEVDYSKMTYQELYTAYLNSYKQIQDINKAMKDFERSIPFCSKCSDRASAKYNGTLK